MAEAVDKLRLIGNVAQLPAGRTLQYYIEQRRAKVSDEVVSWASCRVIPPLITLIASGHFIEQIKDWGFDCFAIDLVSGPDLVLAYLCESHLLHMRVRGLALCVR